MFLGRMVAMQQKVFFSWQADTDSRTGRNFVTDVLERACKRLGSNPDLEEATRDLSVDSDTKGVPGQAPIVDTIFRKIDEASVYVADVTFVAKRIDGRPSPNPNVLIEYGWALKSRGYEKVITLMNTAYGEPSDLTLPFNMKHVLHPIQYHLEEGASSEEKNKVRDQLVKVLEKAIGRSLGSSPETVVSVQPFPEKEPAHGARGPARFRDWGESIGFDNALGAGEHQEIFLTDNTPMWLRVMPTSALNKIWSVPELLSILGEGSTSLSPFIRGRSGYSVLRAEDGVGTFVRAGDNDSVALAVALVFETGEIWAINTTLLPYARKKLFQVDIEKNYTNALEEYTAFLSKLGIEGPYRWIAGMDGTKGRTLSYPPPPNRGFVGDGPVCAASQIIVEGVYDPQLQTPFQSLLPFYKKIFEKCGEVRPEYLKQS
ncbi:MAG: hypothetical protein KBB46_04105 [Candidatus Pacebacteria bacterium]|nr:hypothetical protein [Candidatus Paceibacterota bacterium]